MYAYCILIEKYVRTRRRPTCRMVCGVCVSVKYESYEYVA
jgi:hypothetical protein